MFAYITIISGVQSFMHSMLTPGMPCQYDVCFVVHAVNIIVASLIVLYGCRGMRGWGHVRSAI